MTELLEDLTDRPTFEPRSALSADLLSHVLAQLRLTGDHVFKRLLAGEEPLRLAPREAHVVMVTEGALHVVADGGTPATVETGDLLLLPHGAGDARLVAGGRGAGLVACRFWFDPESLRSMVFALPQRIHIRRGEAEGWIDGIARFVMIEAGDVQPGAALMISRLIDLIVIRALRSWVQQGQSSGWLGGLSDIRIARSLKAIHEAPMQRWSIQALAGMAGMSRSSFCERFTALVGSAPLQYQNEWRLRLARDMLSRREMRVGEVGLSVGYESEAAFSRAYKQFFGYPPRAEYAASNEADGTHPPPPPRERPA